jgi:hypothetical protein
MGSIIIRNFLWALLVDANYSYTGVVSWSDHLVFHVNHPQALSKLWGNIRRIRRCLGMKVNGLCLTKKILKKNESI